MLNTDIVASDIPLLLSRKSMKKANMTLNFKNDHAVIFDQPIQLIVTKSGHYAIPINPYKTILTNVSSGVNTNVNLLATENNKSKNDIAIKLHQQFVHPSPDKNAKIAQLSWGPMTVRRRSQEIKKFSDECAICKIYRKKPQQPVVGLPMATSFQECIAIDLKFYKGRVLLHLIDHATRLSISSFVKSKVIFKSWIQRYGAPEKFLTDNDREFAHSKFTDMAQSMNITVEVTAAESPFSNGLVERYSFIKADLMDKVLEESHLNMDFTLAWCLNAKNSLSSVHGFSPFQLVFQQNPTTPPTFTNKPPAITQHDTSKILADNLTALHKARQTFILSESSEKIRRALNNNVGTSGDTKCITGDSVYFKKINEKRWRGPGKVLGQEGQQVLVKYGSNYVRVHPCRLSLARNAYNSLNPNAAQKSTEPSQIKDKNNSHIILESESEDEIIQVKLKQLQ